MALTTVRCRHTPQLPYTFTSVSQLKDREITPTPFSSHLHTRHTPLATAITA